MPKKILSNVTSSQQDCNRLTESCLEFKSVECNPNLCGLKSRQLQFKNVTELRSLKKLGWTLRHVVIMCYHGQTGSSAILQLWACSWIYLFGVRISIADCVILIVYWQVAFTWISQYVNTQSKHIHNISYSPGMINRCSDDLKSQIKMLIKQIIAEIYIDSWTN